MKMEIHKFCYGCNDYRKMDSIHADNKLSHFVCSICRKRNEGWRKMRDDGLTRLICTECAETFLVVETKVDKCPYCKIHTMSEGVFIPFDEYLKESVEWY